jgi:predicted O-methyltransferase YrrM
VDLAVNREMLLPSATPTSAATPDETSSEAVLARIAALPSDWHRAGTMLADVLAAMVRLLGPRVRRSVETGAGKTTLLLSHLSAHHTVFAVDGEKSLTMTRRSPLLNAERVELVDGPTQRTLFEHRFAEPLDVVLIDGPHGYPFPELEYWVLYRHIREGGWLIVDDIHIPTIHRLFTFLREEPMFELVEVVQYTAFFRRTAAPLFDPYCDGWYLQPFNTSRFPATAAVEPPSPEEDYRERLVPLVASWKASAARVAVFGIGQHTQRLLTLVPELLTLPPVAFLDSSPTHAGTTCCGVPIRTPDWADGHCDIVLCSSFDHELTQMALLDRANVKVVPSHLRQIPSTSAR